MPYFNTNFNGNMNFARLQFLCHPTRFEAKYTLWVRVRETKREEEKNISTRLTFGDQPYRFGYVC